MNHPVGNRYFDSAMPDPNSWSEGSKLESEAESEIVFVTSTPIPTRPSKLGRPSTHRGSTARSIFTILSIERQREADRPLRDVWAEWSCNDGSRGRSLRFFVVAQRFSR